MNRFLKIVDSVYASEMRAMRLVPKMMSFEDDIAIINSYLRRNGLGNMEHEQDGGALIVRFGNGYGLIAEDANWCIPQEMDEDVTPLYTARKAEGSDAVRKVLKGRGGDADCVFYEFTDNRNVEKFDSIEEALDYLFG